jgi:hypothetical protein
MYTRINQQDVEQIIASRLSTCVFLNKNNMFVPQKSGIMGEFHMIYEAGYNNLYILIPF